MLPMSGTWLFENPVRTDLVFPKHRTWNPKAVNHIVAWHWTGATCFSILYAFLFIHTWIHINLYKQVCVYLTRGIESEGKRATERERLLIYYKPSNSFSLLEYKIPPLTFLAYHSLTTVFWGLQMISGLGGRCQLFVNSNNTPVGSLYYIVRPSLAISCSSCYFPLMLCSHMILCVSLTPCGFAYCTLGADMAETHPRENVHWTLRGWTVDTGHKDFCLRALAGYYWIIFQ